MQFGAVHLRDALGAVLAHSVQIDAGRLRKGRVLSQPDLDALADAGLTSVTVARLDANDLDEDRAALALAQALVPDPVAAGLVLQVVGTGRVNILANGPGIARIEAAQVHAVNAIDPAVTLATVPCWHRLDAQGMLATVKIIPYGVDKQTVSTATLAGHNALSLAHPTLKTASLIETTVGTSPDKGYRVTADRLARLSVTLGPESLVPHTETALAEAIRAATGDLILILTASATSDIHDVAPNALRAAGGMVDHFGMPVDPGNLLFIGSLHGRPVIGLPGCAKSPALNGADWVMERLICGVAVTGADIQNMGVGGLLKEIPTRPKPRQPKID